MSAKDMLEFVEKAYNEGNMPVWDYEKYKEEFKEVSAKEMFEKLGYKQEHHISYIKYCKEVEQCCGDLVEIQIWFYQIDECFEKNREVITMEELQAINQQVKELGWLND